MLPESVQVALRSSVLPDQFLGAKRDVQQARLAQDVVSVAEAFALVAAISISTGAHVRIVVLVVDPNAGTAVATVDSAAAAAAATLCGPL